MPVTTVTAAREEPEAPTLDEVLASIEDVLTAHPELDADSREAVRRSVRVDIPQALARRKVRDFWRGFIRRHGLRAAERVSGISRFHLLLVVGDLETKMGVYGTLQLSVGAADDYDAEAAEKVAKKTNGAASKP